MNSIFRPYPNRFTELAEYIDKSSVKELEILYPKLINEIFNSNVKINWGLRTSKLGDNYCSFQAAFDFLSPNGPIFRLCYKLLLDCHLRYEFPYQYLPNVVRKRLEDSSDTSFYKSKLLAVSRMQNENCIYLNAFEFYMFHFAYHLINPAVQLVDENDVEWDTIYLRLVDVYLDHFVPCTSSLVYPLLNQSASAISSSQPAVNSFSPSSKSSPSIFREDVLKKMSPIQQTYTRSKMNTTAETWRSELVATLFIDFWLSSPCNDNKSPLSYAAQKLWSVELLPSKEQLRCIRLLIRHLHYFTNHLLPEDCAMNDLKREIVSSNRRTIYTFFWTTMTQLPLDASYRLLLEAWFTYIQPWRYTNPYYKNIKTIERNVIERKWFSFITENLLAYTRLYYTVLTRLSRCDLTTYKISSMSYRLMQVFSDPQLLEYIVEVENYLEDGSLSSLNSWNSIIRQQICSLERSEYRYEFFYAQEHTQLALELVKQIEESLPTLQSRKKQIQSEDSMSFLKWLKEQLSGNIRYSSFEEIEKIEYYLKYSLKKLYLVHKIPSSDVDANGSFSSITNDIGESFNSFSSFDSTDGISCQSNASLRVDPKERRQAALSCTYEGDPDLYPVRSWESKFLVRVFYYVCLWINTHFQRDLKRVYYEDSITGGIARQILLPPLTTYHFEKRCSPDGYSRRVATLLPPRLSLRRFASYYVLFFLLITYTAMKMCQFDLIKLLLISCALLMFYLTINAVVHPVPVPEDAADSASSR